MRSDNLLNPQAVLLVPLLLGCGQMPIKWDEPTTLPPELASAELKFDSARRLTRKEHSSLAAPSFPRQCSGSARVARDSSTGARYAAWWSVRPDSTADLLASYSADGTRWSPAVRVDSADAGRVGCSRPPPAVEANDGNFFIVYAMTAREGPGIFASHSMDRGRMFHSPVAVAYGERIGRAAIAARGDVVVVAYEDPNTEPRRISVALSRTMGHLFQARVPVSPPSGHARAPDVALGDGRIAVTWLRGDDSTAHRMLRIGQLQ